MALEEGVSMKGGPRWTEEGLDRWRQIGTPAEKARTEEGPLGGMVRQAKGKDAVSGLCEQCLHGS